VNQQLPWNLIPEGAAFWVCPAWVITSGEIPLWTVVVGTTKGVRREAESEGRLRQSTEPMNKKWLHG